MQTIEMSPEAGEEARQAAHYYEEQRNGLGHEFAQELAAGLERIRKAPLTWPVLEGEFRRCALRRFPYIIIYRVEAEKCIVIAVSHQHRRPGYWKARAGFS